MNNVQAVNNYVPDYLVAPGEILEDYLEYSWLTQTALAKRTGLSKKTINEIVKAKSAITAETALKFERTLGRPAHFWSGLERQYQEDKTRLADKIRMESYLNWLDNFPVNDMAKLGWIEKSRDKIRQLEAVLRFFAVASPTQWESIWGRELQVAFRKKEKAKENAGVISVWLRQGEILAQNQPCQQFDKQGFQNSLDEIRKLTTIKEPSVFVPKLKALCSAAGVAIVFVPALPKLGIHGATRWLHDKPMMQLSLHLKTNDHLWFTIFHEACHIIRHGRKELFIEGSPLDNETETESEANAFAQDKLVPSAPLNQFLANLDFTQPESRTVRPNMKLVPHAASVRPSLPQIEHFANSIGIAPGIVVGRLQHDKVLPMNAGNHLKVRYEWNHQEMQGAEPRKG
jgi:addiction module HigA family antidote